MLVQFDYRQTQIKYEMMQKKPSQQNNFDNKEEADLATGLFVSLVPFSYLNLVFA